MVILRAPLSDSFAVGPSFDTLQGFLDNLEGAIARVIEDQARLAEGEDWEAEGYYDEAYLHTLFKSTLARTLRYSTLLLAYSAIDALLSKLCDHVQERLGLRFSRSDMAHSRELRSRLDYLRKALGDALPAAAFGGAFGAKLSAFSRVRHRVAHAGGELAPKQLEQELAQLGLGASGGYITVPKGSAGRLIGEAREWAEAACDAVEKALNSQPSRSAT